MSSVQTDETIKNIGFGRKVIEKPNGKAIVYIAPDGSPLNNVSEVIEYLTTKGKFAVVQILQN